MVNWEELENKQACPFVRFYCCICFEGLKKFTKILGYPTSTLRLKLVAFPNVLEV